MLRWKQVASQFGHTKNREQTPGIGYKRLKNNLIVELEIGSIHNQDRKSVINSTWAKYRSKHPRCLRILDAQTLQWVTEPVKHFWDKECFAIYEPGKDVRYNTIWEPDVDIVCGPGIHYFLTLEAAFCYDLVRTAVFVRDVTDVFEYDQNGQPSGCWNYYTDGCYSSYRCFFAMSLKDLQL
jgi:hypothetical protein